MDTLLSLKVLAAVADQKRFSSVADRLGLSPAMTSKHVQHIEAQVGVRLLNRNSRNVSLTEAGARYLETVRPLLEGLEEAEAQLSDTTLDPRGTLKISMPVWMSNPAFTRILAAYHRTYPHVLLDLDLSGRKINMVEEGIDLALRVSTSLDDGMIARKLTEVDFPLVAAPAFLDRFGRPATIDDLAGAPMLQYSLVRANSPLTDREGKRLKDIGFAPVLRSGNETLIHLGARAGMGFAFLPNWLADEDLASGALERVLPQETWPRVPFNAIYPDRSYLPAKVRSFLDFLTGPEGLRKEPS